jgi:hypothetical protein
MILGSNPGRCKTFVSSVQNALFLGVRPPTEVPAAPRLRMSVASACPADEKMAYRESDAEINVRWNFKC